MTTRTIRVAANADDGEIYPVGTLNGNISIMGKWSDGVAINNWFRFTNVTIPKGAIINSAKITWRCLSTSSGDTCNLKIRGEAADNPSAPTTAADYNGRTRTSAQTTWNSVPHWTAGSDYDSADFAAVVQEIVSRAGWAYGNAMQIFVEDNISSISASRWANDYNDSTSTCALITVEYTFGGFWALA